MSTSLLAVPLPWDLVAIAYANEFVSVFEHYAKEALAMAAPPPGAHVLDVAAGPGTLALLAAKAGHRVSAIDFSDKMIAELRVRAEHVQPPLDIRAGDGMYLPYADASFDAAFSMFGLMFYPDRAKGLRELHRVVKPLGRVVVSSWPPVDRIPHLAIPFGTLVEMKPPPPGTPPFKLALADPEECVAEMAAAGFGDVAVREVRHEVLYPSAVAMWESHERASAPFALAKSQLGTEWEPIGRAIVARMRERFGDGPQKVTMDALLTIGTRG